MSGLGLKVVIETSSKGGIFKGSSRGLQVVFKQVSWGLQAVFNGNLRKMHLDSYRRILKYIVFFSNIFWCCTIEHQTRTIVPVLVSTCKGRLNKKTVCYPTEEIPYEISVPNERSNSICSINTFSNPLCFIMDGIPRQAGLSGIRIA